MVQSGGVPAGLDIMRGEPLHLELRNEVLTGGRGIDIQEKGQDHLYAQVPEM